MPHSQQLNNGGWWKPELGSTLSLSHSEWQESPGLVSFGDKVLHLPALLCLHLPTTDDCKSAEIFLFSWCIGHPLPCRRVKYSCCNPHYTEMTLWQGCVCVCLSVSSCFTCGCSCEMSPSQWAASSQLPHVTRGRAGEHQVIDGKKRHGKTVSSANVPLETEPSEQSAPGNHSQQPLSVAAFSLQHPRPIPPPAAR